MSDLYDSLEDECDENKCKSGSPDKTEKTECDDGAFENESPKNYSFYLRGDSSEDGKNLEFNKTFRSDPQKKHFLPKIENKISDKGVESVRNVVLENQILSQQGLQLNKDGSITKSPRCETEELPFISREYRNIQFQKKKTYTSNKKITPLNNQEKNNVKEIAKPVDGMSLKQLNSPNRKQGLIEKITTSNSLLSNSSQSNGDKQLTSNYNMTDSMKEKLLQSQKENLPKAFTTVRNFKKTKCEMKSEAPDVSRQDKFSDQKEGDQIKTFRFTHRFEKNANGLDSSQKQVKTFKLKIHGYLSDISLTTLRPKLNYSERHQLENGFNVFHLKQLNKKVESDSNRSNFGDSVVEELPDVSNVRVSCDDSEREEEELFYKKLIEKDMHLTKQSHHSARSEGPVRGAKLESINGSHSVKNHAKITEDKKNTLKSKSIIKAMDIDMPPEVENVVNSKKFSHFCSPTSSTNASKIELALKGKTYGYLANARNIFRLKAQSEKKLNEATKGRNLQINQNISPPSKKISNFSRSGSKPKKYNSPSVGIFPILKGGLPRYLEKSPKGSKSFSRTKIFEASWETQKEFILPQVPNQKITNSKNSKE